MNLNIEELKKKLAEAEEIAKKQPMNPNKHPLAGKTIKLKSKDPQYDGQTYRVEDYWHHIAGGKSWMFAEGNPACLNYALHSGTHGLPRDNDVVYGKIGSFGHLMHESELGEEEG